jgi:hypothetical protein
MKKLILIVDTSYQESFDSYGAGEELYCFLHESKEKALTELEEKIIAKVEAVIDIETKNLLLSEKKLQLEKERPRTAKKDLDALAQKMIELRRAEIKIDWSFNFANHALNISHFYDFEKNIFIENSYQIKTLDQWFDEKKK